MSRGSDGLLSDGEPCFGLDAVFRIGADMSFITARHLAGWQQTTVDSPCSKGACPAKLMAPKIVIRSPTGRGSVASVWTLYERMSMKKRGRERAYPEDEGRWCSCPDDSARTHKKINTRLNLRLRAKVRTVI